MRALQAVFVVLVTRVLYAVPQDVRNPRHAHRPANEGQKLDDRRTFTATPHSFQGKHMNIHGQSVYDVFAKPVVPDDGTSVRYDGFATFIQGDNQFTYVVVDGAAYVEKSVGNDSTSVATKADRCLESITPFDSIVAALNTVKAIPNIDSVWWSGLDFTLCSSAAGFIAYGGDITMAVEYLASPLRDLTAPTLSDKSKVCNVLATTTPVTSTAAALLTGNTNSAVCPSNESC